MLQLNTFALMSYTRLSIPVGDQDWELRFEGNCYNIFMGIFKRNPKTNRTIRIIGIVQGVGFRWFVKEKAEKLEISGYVGNMEDGTVQIEAEGTKKNLEKFTEEVKRGTTSARIHQITVKSGKVKGHEGFEIKY